MEPNWTNATRTAMHLFSFLGILLSPTLIAQPHPSAALDIYSEALVQAARQMQREWGDLQDSALDPRTFSDYRHVLVCRDASVRADFPENDGKRRFEYLDSRELLARRKKASKAFSVLIVNPARLDGTRIKVVVEQRWVDQNHGRIVLAVSDWGAVFFRFDCATREFVFDEVKLGGIWTAWRTALLRPG
jgi:hypothetical protein